MLIAWAQNKTWDAKGRRVGSDKGYSNYECGVKINDTVLWEGKVEGHLRKSGASVLLRRIAMAMEKSRPARGWGVRDYLIRIVRNAYPCSCDVAYTDRGLTSPDCFHCVPLAEAAAQLEDALAGDTSWLVEYLNAEGNCIGFYAPEIPAGTDNPQAALRLSRREDAEAVRRSLPDGHLMRSAEHVFTSETGDLSRAALRGGGE